MYANGFLDQRPSHKASLGLVLLLHAGVISAVVLIKGNEWIRAPQTDTTARFDVEQVPPPPPPPPPPPTDPKPRTEQTSLVHTPDPIVQTEPLPNPTIGTPDLPPLPSFDSHPGPVTPPAPVGTQLADATPVRPPSPPPVRIDSSFAPGAQLQPPYPADEQRREREGTVRIRVSIGTDGQVTSAEQVSATSDSFWRETQRWAVGHWRFRPATVDGRPVQSTKVLTIHFQLGA